MWPRRTTLLILLFVLLGVAGAAVFVGRHVFVQHSQAVEIGVLFPGTSDRTWIDFLDGVQLAARDLRLSTEVRAGERECLVRTSNGPVIFRWYPEAGSRGLRRRVSEVCQSAQPPLAIVGANNSSLTQALAGELSRCSNRATAPLLLMTNSTADRLIDIHPGRSFRFGYNNSYQAKTVVARLKQFYADNQVATPAVRTLVVQILDDPFTLDLAERFADELRALLGATCVPPTERFRSTEGCPESWTLTTSTGSFDDPNTEEWELAQALVAQISQQPEAQWVLALPVGANQYRRLSFALHRAAQEAKGAMDMPMSLANLVVLSGDSMDFYDFFEADLNQLLVEETPAPIILFAHVNPIDPRVSESPQRHIPMQSLNRDVATTLLSVLPELERPSPEALAHALAEYVSKDSDDPLFRNGERHQGGGAIVIVPRTSKNEFEIHLPPEWRNN